MTGTIHTLNERYFGFIQPSDDPSPQGRHFFHGNSVVNSNFAALQVGDVVSFESVQGERGLKAIDVKLEGE